MFFVLNKQKIYTYIVSAVMVLFLFCAASTLNVNNDNNTVQTSATYSKLLPIYNVQTDEKKVAFTMNCAWNADDIDSILETLKNNNVKITFFMVGDWIDDYPEVKDEIIFEFQLPENTEFIKISIIVVVVALHSQSK